MLPLFIILPLGVLLVLNLPWLQTRRRIAFPAAILLALAQIATVIAQPAGLAERGTRLAHFMALGLAADSLAFVLLLTIGLVVLATLLVGNAMIKGDRAGFYFVSLLLLSLIGMNGVVLLTDLFSLYVFLEATAIASFILIAFHRDANGLEGAFKYLILSAVATLLMLTGVALLLLVAGGTGFELVGKALLAGQGGGLVKLAMGLFLCGLFIKGGVVPFHGWLPGTYAAAPAPVSVLLAGVVTKVSGIYALIRLTTGVFPASDAVNSVLLAAGALSVVVGAFAAIGQKDMKWLLAYSSISQIGYILLGVGSGSELGIAAAVLHLFNHGVFKSLLFVNAAAVERQTGTTDMSKLGGLGGRMPVTGFTNVIALLSTAGIPPLAGFWSKLMIVIALWQAQYYGYAALAVLFSVVTLAYMLIMHRRVFFGKTPANLSTVQDAPVALLVPAVLLAAVTVGVGLGFPWLFNTFLFPLSGLL